jgi:hypothetical protein
MMTATAVNARAGSGTIVTESLKPALVGKAGPCAEKLESIRK